MQADTGASSLPHPYFVQRCRVCGQEIITPWGPEVHDQSRFAVRNHIEKHSEAQMLAFARQEALRGI